MVSFHSGDQVQLHSGGALMLVTNDNADGTVICFWFSEEEDQLVWRSFASADLRLVRPHASAVTGAAPPANASGGKRPRSNVRALRR